MTLPIHRRKLVPRIHSHKTVGIRPSLVAIRRWVPGQERPTNLFRDPSAARWQPPPRSHQPLIQHPLCRIFGTPGSSQWCRSTLEVCPRRQAAPPDRPLRKRRSGHAPRWPRPNLSQTMMSTHHASIESMRKLHQNRFPSLENADSRTLAPRSAALALGNRAPTFPTPLGSDTRVAPSPLG